MSGETITAIPRGWPAPSCTSAGAWKHSDLPPPVGSTTTLSRDARMAAIASRWSGRKLEKPHTWWSTSCSARSASRVSRLDVVIHEALERGGQLFVGAAQRRHVLPVDEDGTMRRFTGARQADADV